MALGAFAVWSVLPERTGGPALLVCPFHWFTGLLCTGCGATRAAGALLRGDFVQALAFNPVAAVLFPTALAAAIRHAFGVLLGHEARVRPARPWIGQAALLILAAFTVARNLPWMAFAPLRPHRVESGPLARPGKPEAFPRPGARLVP